MPAANPFIHDSVLLRKVVELFEPVEDGTIVDATTGAGGHSLALAEARPGRRLLCLDQDPDALAAARERLAGLGDRVRFAHTRFDHLPDVVTEADRPIRGVLFDLGVSSPQFDRGERGFSYRHDGPLDMRMDPSSDGPTAADLVNGLPANELARLLRHHGDERFADRVARAIVAARPVTATVQLAEIVRAAIPAATRRTGGHPAKRTFQALRIAVNDEAAVLDAGLDAALDLVAPGGRVAVITFHSGEDRAVKRRFRLAETGGCTCPTGLPCACGAVREFRLLKRGGWTPTPDELHANPRSASARLRAVEKLRTPDTPEVRS